MYAVSANARLHAKYIRHGVEKITRCLCPGGLQVDAIRNGTALILSCRKAKRYDEAAMNAAAQLLKVVPEVRMPSCLLAHAPRTHTCACMHA